MARMGMPNEVKDPEPADWHAFLFESVVFAAVAPRMPQLRVIAGWRVVRGVGTAQRDRLLPSPSGRWGPTDSPS
jgi:hypothetical protein